MNRIVLFSNLLICFVYTHIDSVYFTFYRCMNRYLVLYFSDFSKIFLILLFCFAVNNINAGTHQKQCH